MYHLQQFTEGKKGNPKSQRFDPDPHVGQGVTLGDTFHERGSYFPSAP
mgnify:CR=1 FL=1